ncbi:MAG: hypothetical protein LUF01_14275 [Bacteroides sp.]|nr:hypothetical protein [Bacteroides sp.]
MNITKAKITKDNTLVASFKNENEDNVTIEGKNLVHKDLKAAFNALIPHLTFLCEQKEADGKVGLDELTDGIYSTFDVSGYSIGGSDDDEGVTLVGKRFLKSKKVLNLIAPFTKFSNENEEYDHAFDLMQAIEACNYEVERYLTARKWAIVQQELPFDENAPANITADPVGDAAFEEEANEFLKQVAEQTGTTLIVNGKKVKPRNSRKKAKETAA